MYLKLFFTFTLLLTSASIAGATSKSNVDGETILSNPDEIASFLIEHPGLKDAFLAYSLAEGQMFHVREILHMGCKDTPLGSSMSSPLKAFPVTVYYKDSRSERKTVFTLSCPKHMLK